MSLKSTICPFCSYPHLAVDEDETGLCQVYCFYCHACGPQVQSKKYAILQWEEGLRKGIGSG